LSDIRRVWTIDRKRHPKPPRSSFRVAVLPAIQRRRIDRNGATELLVLMRGGNSASSDISESLGR